MSIVHWYCDNSWRIRLEINDYKVHAYSIKGQEFVRDQQGSLWSIVDASFPEFRDNYYKWQPSITKVVKAFLGLNIYDDPVWNSDLTNGYITPRGLKTDNIDNLGADVTMGYIFGPN
jgi:hypothetical protein